MPAVAGAPIGMSMVAAAAIGATLKDVLPQVLGSLVRDGGAVSAVLEPSC